VTEIPGRIVTLKVPACVDCKHFRETTVFLLCIHPDSKYEIAGKADQHTAGHMRRMGCGEDAKLFDPKQA